MIKVYSIGDILTITSLVIEDNEEYAFWNSFPHLNFYVFDWDDVYNIKDPHEETHILHLCECFMVLNRIAVFNREDAILC